MSRLKSNLRNRSIKNFVIIFIVIAAVGFILFQMTARPANAEDRVTEEQRYKYYTSIYVESGDSLWSIASQYMTADYDSIYEYMAEVKNINHLQSDFLKSGTRLCVPYYSSDYKI